MTTCQINRLATLPRSKQVQEPSAFRAKMPKALLHDFINVPRQVCRLLSASRQQCLRSPDLANYHGLRSRTPRRCSGCGAAGSALTPRSVSTEILAALCFGIGPLLQNKGLNMVEPLHNATSRSHLVAATEETLNVAIPTHDIRRRWKNTI